MSFCKCNCELWLADMDTDEGVETADKASASAASTNGKNETTPTKDKTINGGRTSDDPAGVGATSSGSGTDSDKEPRLTPKTETSVSIHGGGRRGGYYDRDMQKFLRAFAVQI